MKKKIPSPYQWDAVFTKQKRDMVITAIRNEIQKQIVNECNNKDYDTDWTKVYFDPSIPPHIMCKLPIPYNSLPSCSNRAVFLVRQLQALYSKSLDLEVPNNDKAENALNTFLEGEQACRDTNEALRSSYYDDNHRGHLLYRLSRKISEALGDVPSLSDLKLTYGPGGSTSVKRAQSNPRIKISADLDVCPNMIRNHQILEEFLNEIPHISAHHSLVIYDDVSVVTIRHAPCRMNVVEKNAFTGRTVCTEPTYAGMVQRAIGNYIKSKMLNAFNVDLRSQQRNQHLAFKGSCDGTISTIDTKNASNTFSYMLALEGLPLPWFEFLDSFRSDQVVFPDGSVKDLEMFSSMGNGYTFELESLFFYVIAFLAYEDTVHSMEDNLLCDYPSKERLKQVRDLLKERGLTLNNISVFGDDLCVPTLAYNKTVEYLKLFGFEVNLDKSFSSGPFRESCGRDYFHGYSVRPYYYKGNMSTSTLFQLHNFFVRNGEIELASVVLEYVHHSFRSVRGPDGYGDGHLIGSWVPCSKRSYTRRGWSGSTFDTFTAVGRSFRRPLPGDYIFPMYSIYAAHEYYPSSDLEELRSHNLRTLVNREGDLYVVPGEKGYQLTSIYTLDTTVFRKI